MKKCRLDENSGMYSLMADTTPDVSHKD